MVLRTKIMDRSKAISQIGGNSLKSTKKKKTSLEIVSSGVPQGSILRPLLLLLYVKDLKNASNILDLTIFADDTNFHTQRY